MGETDQIRIPNIPITCLLHNLWLRYPRLLELGVLDASSLNMGKAFLQGFWWQGLNGDQTFEEIDKLDKARELIIPMGDIGDEQGLRKIYFETITSNLLCNFCPLYINKKCRPLLIKSNESASILVVPIVTTPEIITIEYYS